MEKKVLIIGNGFDLDLGWHTRYSDFAKSEYWPFKEDNIISFHLDGYLCEQKDINNWFDLEECLYQYSKKGQKNIEFLTQEDVLSKNKQFFKTVSASLSQYLSEIQKNPINKQSYAAKVLAAIIENGYFSSIYTFNYTDLNKIAAQLGKRMPKFEYVHGSIENNNLILGISDKRDVIQGYSFLYKTFSRHYLSHHILADLNSADEVVFFGHSLAENDYHYFEDYFKRQSSENLADKDSNLTPKKITIFTYDDDSRIQILEQLRTMNSKRTDLLFNLNDFQIIHTKDRSDDNKLEAFLQHMKEDSTDAHLRNLNRLASML